MSPAASNPCQAVLAAAAAFCTAPVAGALSPLADNANVVGNALNWVFPLPLRLVQRF
jgi:hypothetical protein